MNNSSPTIVTIPRSSSSSSPYSLGACPYLPHDIGIPYPCITDDLYPSSYKSVYHRNAESVLYIPQPPTSEGRSARSNLRFSQQPPTRRAKTGPVPEDGHIAGPDNGEAGDEGWENKVRLYTHACERRRRREKAKKTEPRGAGDLKKAEEREATVTSEDDNRI